MTIRLVKTCPICGHANDPGEFYCVGILPTEQPCGFTLFDVPALPEGGQPIHPELVLPAADLPGPPAVATPEVEAPEDGPTSDGRSCLNGHAMQANDQICLSCGASAAEASEHLGDDPSSGASEALTGQLLDAIPVESRADDNFLRTFLRGVHAQLETYASDGRGHGAICPDSFVVHSVDPAEIARTPVVGRRGKPNGAVGTGLIGVITNPRKVFGLRNLARRGAVLMREDHIYAGRNE